VSFVAPSRGRLRRISLLLIALAALVALASCQNRVGAAAVIGDQRITVDELQAMVSESLAAPGVRAQLANSQYAGDLGKYRRAILNIAVERRLAEQAAARAGVTVDDSVVDARYSSYERQFGGPAPFAAELARQVVVSPAVFREMVRTEVIEAELGYETGGVHRPTEAELRALFEQYAPTATTVTLRLVALPDQATARRVSTRLKKDPSSFDEVAKQYPNPQTGNGQPQKFKLTEIPPDLAAKVQKLPAGSIVDYVVDQSGQQTYLVIKYDGATRPTLESSRAQLEESAARRAAAAGQKKVRETAEAVTVRVNPRYGSFDADKLSIGDFINPAVKAPPSPTPAGQLGPGSGGAPGSGGGG
jgi:SurA N-terminal domain/PPIC-type PPIASE domain